MHFACKNPLNNGAHPHNVWLQFLAEWGIPFTLIITAGFYYLTRHWVRRVRDASRQDRALALPITASLSAALVHSLFDGLAVMPLSQLFGIVLFGCALSWYRNAAVPPTPRSPSFASLLLGLPGLLLFFYVILNLPGLTERQEAELLLGPGHYQPRFWSQGMICL
jgi:Kef-type K+ transport system membrane component KefB